MKLTVIASGSKGNCYLLHNDKEALMIEAGVPGTKVLQHLKSRFKNLVACLVTHEHKDHAKYVRDVLSYGIPVYMTKGTAIAAKLDHPMVRTFSADGITYETVHEGGFHVIPFSVIHDASEPCGFYITHREIGNLLFVTDTHYLVPRFAGMTNIMIECNYDERLLEKRDVPETLKERIRGSHMSKDSCIDTLLSNSLAKVNNIVLLHISEGDGDPEGFRKEVEEATRKKTWAATAGLTIDINATPF